MNTCSRRALGPNPPANFATYTSLAAKLINRFASTETATRSTRTLSTCAKFHSTSHEVSKTPSPLNKVTPKAEQFLRDIASVSRTHKLGLQCRSMVTITKTKSSEMAPLFSSEDLENATSTTTTTTTTYAVNEDASLIVTESCLNQVERLLRQRREKEGRSPDEHDGYFLRVFVDAGGCSGFQYQFEVDNELDEDDDIVVVMAKSVEDEDAVLSPRVVVDEASLEFLKGSTVDFVIEMIKSAFVVTDNPQSESACGCGSSFAMKNFEKFGAKD